MKSNENKRYMASLVGMLLWWSKEGVLVNSFSSHGIARLGRLKCESRRNYRLQVSRDDLKTNDLTVREEESNLYLENQVMSSSNVLPDAELSLKDKIMEKIGSIDESRMSFPEYSNGDVNRLYSNLKYEKLNGSDKSLTASHDEGSTLAATALIAGTTIGAGILALPTATAPVGFLPSTVGLLIAAGYMVVSGLLIAELAINRTGQTGKPGVGLLELYRNSLGEKYAFVGSGAYLFLHFAIMVAYISQGGANLETAMQSAGLESLSSIPGIGQIAFTSIIGAFLYFAQKSVVEATNNTLVLGVVVSFLSIIGIGFGTADFGALIATETQHPEKLADAFPILFLSLVYQNVVPTVVTQLEGNRNKITIAIIGGVAIPLLMFLAWNAVIIGNILAIPNIDLTNVDPVGLLQSEGVGGEGLSTLVSVFSELAVVTSLIGFVYGIIDAFTDLANLPTSGPDYDKWKPLLFIGALLPPMMLALGNPDIFYSALDYGGAFGVSTLFLVLPPLMAWKERYGEEAKPLTVRPMVPFGKIPLGSCWKAAGTLIIEQGADKLGIIDFLAQKVHF